MTSPSSILKIPLQDLADNLNTWGLDTSSGGLNRALLMLERASAGVQTLSLTGNKTLSSTNYDKTNETTPRIQRLTDGGLSAAPTITIPATVNWWVVFNTTSYAATYDNGANSASVTAGRTAIVYTDGTNVYSLNIFTSADQTYPGALSYTFSTTTTDADPGSGNLRLDNATQGSATGIYISDTDANAADVSGWLLTWDDSTSTVPCRIILRSKATPANFQIYAVTALTDNAGYMDFTVTHVDGNGSLANGEAITVTPVFNGDKGDTGAQGPAGTITDAGDGTVASPGFAFAADTNTGLYRSASGTIGVSSDGAEVTEFNANGQNLKDKRIDRPVLRDYAESLVTANTSTAYTIDLENGNVFDLTLTGNCTYTFSNPPASGSAGAFTLIQNQDGTGSRTVTWPASVEWAGGSAPTITSTASSTDVFTFITTDGGTTWYGFTGGQDFS